MMMWGDPIGAATLNQPIHPDSTQRSSPTPPATERASPSLNDNSNADLNPKQQKCISSMYQITGPAHIPTNDIRWQELFLSYDILVHLDRGHIHTNTDRNHTLMDQVCNSMAKHTRNSSNLAGFAWHLTKMMNELMTSCAECSQKVTPTTRLNSSNNDDDDDDDDDENNRNNRNNLIMRQSHTIATAKITMVGKARVVCGALNLFRILCHEVITASLHHREEIESAPPTTTINDDGYQSYEFLQEAFTYKSRQKESTGSLDIDTASQLLSTLLSFMSIMGQGESGESGGNLPSALELLKTVPELYDAIVLSLMLLTVLFSTQLYQPLLSSFELRDELYNHHHNNKNHEAEKTSKILHRNFFLDNVMNQAYDRRQKSSNYRKYHPNENKVYHSWTSQSILSSLLNWMIDRPETPQRSIAAHLRDMVYTIARDVKGEKIGTDGMFESHTIIMARAPQDDKTGENGDAGIKAGDNQGYPQASSSRGPIRHRSAPKVIMDATNKVIHLSSSLFLLPFRLMTLALRALGHPEQYLLRSVKGSGERYDDVKIAQLQAAYGARGGSNDSMASPTNDVLWISDSPVADFGTSIFLILTNNYRAGEVDGVEQIIKNAFRSDLASLDDNRWDGWNNDNTYMDDNQNVFGSVELGENKVNGNETDTSLEQRQTPKPKILLTINFENLFQSFGGTLHNEVGALSLYTMLQASPIFAASLAVRSDLDMLILPLLRTLYFSSISNHHIAGRTATASAKMNPSGSSTPNSSKTVSVTDFPFRSQSQLYVIMILLLIFSQDTSFGPDSFRRSNIAQIVWYKERSLKNISLGSMIILSLLRCITFNLNRLQDPFLLSNCCAVLLNLSPHIAKLHPYTASRLASVLVSSMKRYTVLVMKNGGKPAEEGDVSSLLGMYAETCRILSQVVKHSIRRKVVDKNLHLVYALVYHQRDFKTVLKAKRSPFRLADMESITTMLDKADTLIGDASARTADKAMEVLENSKDILKGSKSNRNISSSSASVTDDSTISTTSSSTVSGMEDFRFTYEEEADPEIFFVPYLWEVIVSCVGSSSIEWNKKTIKTFALLEYEQMDQSTSIENQQDTNELSNGLYAKDEGDVV